MLSLSRARSAIALNKCKGSEVAQFYEDCRAESFCFGTVDTCSGTIAGSDLADAEDGGDCSAYFASHTGWCDGCAACDGSDKEPCRAACPAGCTYAVESVTNDPGTCAEAVSVAADAAACAAVTALDDATACEAERTASTGDAAETPACTYTPGGTDTPGTCAEAVSVAADAAACAAVTALGDATACDAVRTASADDAEDTAACAFTPGVPGSTTAGRGWWNRASGCESTATGCKTMAELYPGGGGEMVEELWAYGTDPAFVTVPEAEETATNSFSLFGGSATTETDHTDAPLTQENPNDDVCLTGDCAKLFPAAPTCTHVTDCVNEVSACTSACETAADRTEVVTVAPTYGGAACADLSPTDCESGDGQCPAEETAAEETTTEETTTEEPEPETVAPTPSTASAAAAGECAQHCQQISLPACLRPRVPAMDWCLILTDALLLSVWQELLLCAHRFSPR